MSGYVVIVHARGKAPRLACTRLAFDVAAEELENEIQGQENSRSNGSPHVDVFLVHKSNVGMLPIIMRSTQFDGVRFICGKLPKEIRELFDPVVPVGWSE